MISPMYLCPACNTKAFVASASSPSGYLIGCCMNCNNTAQIKKPAQQSRKPGPKPKGYIKVLVGIPAEYLELMKWNNERCGGLNPVNEQIRQAIRGMLCGLVYISLLKS